MPYYTVITPATGFGIKTMNGRVVEGPEWALDMPFKEFKKQVWPNGGETLGLDNEFEFDDYWVD